MLIQILNEDIENAQNKCKDAMHDCVVAYAVRRMTGCEREQVTCGFSFVGFTKGDIKRGFILPDEVQNAIFDFAADNTWGGPRVFVTEEIEP